MSCNTLYNQLSYLITCPIQTASISKSKHSDLPTITSRSKNFRQSIYVIRHPIGKKFFNSQQERMKRHTRGSKLFCLEHILANPTKKLFQQFNANPYLLTQHNTNFVFLFFAFNFVLWSALTAHTNNLSNPQGQRYCSRKWPQAIQSKKGFKELISSTQMSLSI